MSVIGEHIESNDGYCTEWHSEFSNPNSRSVIDRCRPPWDNDR
jgi:hypothetical protein